MPFHLDWYPHLGCYTQNILAIVPLFFLWGGVRCLLGILNQTFYSIIRLFSFHFMSSIRPSIKSTMKEKSWISTGCTNLLAAILGQTPDTYQQVTIQHNNYPAVFVSKKKKVEDHNKKFVIDCLPYIRVTPEKTERICDPYTIWMIFRSSSTLWNQAPALKKIWPSTLCILLVQLLQEIQRDLAVLTVRAYKYQKSKWR